MEETSTDKNQRGYELYNEIIECWKYTWYDKKTDTNYYRPTSYKQVQKAVENIKKIDELKIDDPELKQLTEGIRTVTENATKRIFIGSKWVVILSGIAVMLLMFLAFSQYKGFRIKYPPEQANKIYTEAIQNYKMNLEKYSLNEKTGKANDYKGSEKVRKKRYKFYKKRLEKAENQTPEEYLKKLNSARKRIGIKGLFKGFFYILLYASYFYVARAPIYLINRRERELEFIDDTSDKISSRLRRTFTSLLLAPTSVTETRWSSGRVTREDNFFAEMTLRILIIILLAGLIIGLAVYMLPILVIVNYLRNYQFEKMEKLIHLIKKKLKLKGKDESDDCGSATV